MYNLLKNVAYLALLVLFGLKVIGRHHVPNDGGAVIAASHSNYVDPVAIGVVLDRPIYFMAKKELYRTAVMRLFMSFTRAFPVERGNADRHAIRTAVEVVSRGDLLGIFPQGRRVRQNDQSPLQGGAALIALKTGVPIVPVAVSGAEPLRFRKPITLRMGAPIHVNPSSRVRREDVEKVNLAIAEEFRSLFKQESADQ